MLKKILIETWKIFKSWLDVKPDLRSFFFGEIPLVKSGLSSRLIEHFFAAAGTPMIHALDSSKTQFCTTRNLWIKTKLRPKLAMLFTALKLSTK